MTNLAVLVLINKLTLRVVSTAVQNFVIDPKTK